MARYQKSVVAITFAAGTVLILGTAVFLIGNGMSAQADQSPTCLTRRAVIPEVGSDGNSQGQVQSFVGRTSVQIALQAVATCTPIANSTATQTPSPTPTATGTVTQTPSPTPSPTGTVGNTATPTVTSTQTLTPTATTVSTATPSPTGTVGNTATPTATSTSTQTPTPAPTTMPTPTPTVTPTATPTVSCTPGGGVKFTSSGGVHGTLAVIQSFTVDPWQFCPGNTVNITVSISSSTPITSVEWRFVYDTGISDPATSGQLILGTTTNGTWVGNWQSVPTATTNFQYGVYFIVKNGSTDQMPDPFNPSQLLPPGTMEVNFAFKS